MIIKGQNISSRNEKIIFRWGVFSALYSLFLFRVLEDNNFGESKKIFSLYYHMIRALIVTCLVLKIEFYKYQKQVKMKKTINDLVLARSATKTKL